MSYHTMLSNNSERLGIKDPSVIKKGDEFLRILNSKQASKSLNEVAKVILCLDLAVTSLGSTFDKETAIKLTGLRKTVYQNSLNNVEKILDLDKPLTVSELCVQLSCTVVRESAEMILNRFKETNQKITDINHPQYVAASVFTACKLKKVKVEKSKFLAISRLKTSQWNELTEEFKRVAVFTKEKKEDLINTENLEIIEPEHGSKTSKKCRDDEEQFEEYEEWRDRILREAAKEIMMNELGN